MGLLYTVNVAPGATEQQIDDGIWFTVNEHRHHRIRILLPGEYAQYGISANRKDIWLVVKRIAEGQYEGTLVSFPEMPPNNEILLMALLEELDYLEKTGNNVLTIANVNKRTRKIMERMNAKA